MMMVTMVTIVIDSNINILTTKPSNKEQTFLHCIAAGVVTTQKVFAMFDDLTPPWCPGMGWARCRFHKYG